MALSFATLPGTPSSADWPVAGGGDEFRTGYARGEQPPYFAGRGVSQPKPEWVTKLSDFPSGIFPMGGAVVAEGLVMVGGAATNTFLALDQDTGLPVWRFSPDPRGSKYAPGDGYSGAYPATNAPWYQDGFVYVTFSNGVLYKLDASTGERVWRWEVPAAGAPGEVKDHVLPAAEEWDYHNPEHNAFPLRAEVRPFTGDYPKFHSAVNFCDGKVVVETMDARVYVVNASTGRTIWHRYVGAPDWPGEFVFPEFERGGIVPASGRSTRRFEAQPGAGCFGQYVFVPVEDGFVKVFKSETGLFVGRYDGHHEGDLGWAHDAAAGLLDPRTKDLVFNFLNNRMIRINVPQLEPRWRHIEDSGQLSLCVNQADRETCTVVPTSEGRHQDGPIGGAVFGGQLALDPVKRIIANPNQDGHLYLWSNIDTVGQNPTLIARVPTRKNPYSKPNPRKDSINYYVPRDGKEGPWEHRTAVLSAPVMAGGVVYFPASWEHAIYGVKYLENGRIMAEPEVVFRYEVKWDPEFMYPPFGDTYKRPIVDIDLLTMGSMAVSDGHLYLGANDGSIYSFDLQQPTANTQRNLAILGSGLVPFIPTWDDPRGVFDRIWTPAEWYKNQDNPNEGWRLPTPGQIIPLGLPVAAFGLWARRRSRRRRALSLASSATPEDESSRPAGPRGRWEGIGWP
jgi:outer membrane protein assembly factor BamB